VNMNPGMGNPALRNPTSGPGMTNPSNMMNPGGFGMGSAGMRNVGMGSATGMTHP
jgi:hypothetical protein